jgi:hypothetical protein
MTLSLDNAGLGTAEAMWGIYANDPNKRFLRSTPRKLFASLIAAHPQMPHCRAKLGVWDWHLH